MISSHKQNSHLREKLLAIRKKAKLSQQQVAELMGVKQPHVCRMEKEGYFNHSIQSIVSYARACGHVVRIEFVLIGSSRDDQTEGDEFNGQ